MTGNSGGVSLMGEPEPSLKINSQANTLFAATAANAALPRTIARLAAG